MRNQQTLAAALVGALLAGGAGATLLRPGAVVPTHWVVLVLDRSLTADPTNRCVDAARIADSLATREGAAVHLFLRVTGTGQSAEEPVALGEFSPERVFRYLDHAPADATVPSAFSTRVRTACEGSSPTVESPLFAAARSALDEVRPLPGTRSLWIRTDGVEEVDAVLRARLRGRARVSPPRLDNQGVDVTFCGGSARTVASGAAQPSRAVVEDAWRLEFAVPASLRFVPTCVAALAG